MPPKPLVTYAGVAIPAQRIPWSFRPGLRPHTFSVKLLNDRAKPLLEAAAASGNIADLAIKATLGGFGEDVEIDVLIKGIVLVAGDGSSSPWDTVLTLADARYWLEGELVTADYNVTRTTNERGAEGEEPVGPASERSIADGGTRPPGAGGGGSVAPPTGGAGGGVKADQSAPLKQGADRVLTFPLERYLPWSLRDGRHPCTALYVAKDLLDQVVAKNAGTPRGDVAAKIRAALEDGKIKDNGFWEDDVAHKREDAVQAIEHHLEKAEVSVGIGEDGKVYAYNRRGETVALDEPGAEKLTDELLEIIKPLFPTIYGGGFMNVRKNGLRRAARHATEFPMEWELRVECKEPWDATYETTLAPYAQNVLRLPQDVTYGGKTYRKGTWMGVDDALAAWSADGTLPLAFNPWSRPPLDAERLRAMWFPSGKLGIAYGHTLNAGGDFTTSSIWGPRVNALLSSYRQVWRLNPALADYVLAMQLRRARIVDARSRFYAPAFVAADHCVVPDITLPEFKYRRGQAGTNVTCWADDNRETTHAAHLTLSFEDPALYVVRIAADTTKLVDGERVSQVIPSKVDNLPILAAAGLMSNEIWANASLASTFNATFIVTVTWAQHPDKLKGTKLADKGSLVNAAGQTWRVESAIGPKAEANEYLSLSTADSRVTARRTKAADLANADTMQQVADARAEAYYARMRDRLVGRYEMPGYADAYRLFGTVAAIDLMLDEEGRLHAIWDLTGPPHEPDELLKLPEAVRRQLAQRLGDVARGAPHGAAAR